MSRRWMKEHRDDTAAPVATAPAGHRYDILNAGLNQFQIARDGKSIGPVLAPADVVTVRDWLRESGL